MDKFVDQILYYIYEIYDFIDIRYNVTYSKL